MYGVYLLSVFLHVLAAIAWVGGMLFLVLVVVPWLRRGDRAQAARLMRETGRRFRDVGWACFVVLLATGTFNLWFRGVRFSSFTDEAWLSSTFGRVVILKLLIFALVLGVSGVHDFVLGPRATIAVEADPSSSAAERLRKQASLLGRLNVLFAFALVGAGIVLVRGWAF